MQWGYKPPPLQQGHRRRREKHRVCVKEKEREKGKESDRERLTEHTHIVWVREEGERRRAREKKGKIEG